MTTPGRPAPSSLAAQRLRAQLLSGAPARTVAGVTGHLLAVQAQDPRGARLAVRARTSGLLATDVDDALTADRSVVVSWLNRGTLHLVLAEDYWWLHQLTTPQLATGNARRLAQEGVPPADADRGAGVIERSLAADGPLTRAELRERVAAAGVRTEGQAMVHLLALAIAHLNRFDFDGTFMESQVSDVVAGVVRQFHVRLLWAVYEASRGEAWTPFRIAAPSTDGR